jgi:hypothetical protein
VSRPVVLRPAPGATVTSCHNVASPDARSPWGARLARRRGVESRVAGVGQQNGAVKGMNSKGEGRPANASAIRPKPGAERVDSPLGKSSREAADEGAPRYPDPAAGRDLRVQGRLKLRVAWATCVHESGHAILAVVLGYNLGFSDVSEVLALIADAVADASSVPRTGFTRIFQLGAGYTPAIAFAVAGKAAEAVHDLIDDLPANQSFDVARWRDGHWGKDDDLTDAHTKAFAEVGGSERKAWLRVERDYQRTVKLLGKRALRAATLEIASMLMRDGRVQAEAVFRIANRWGISAAPRRRTLQTRV